MKKHPVDDLFKSKLSGLEKQPSAAAWARISKEQKNGSRKVGIWIWYAAAGIVVTMMAGYLVWQGSQNRSVEKTISKLERPKSAQTAIIKDSIKLSTDKIGEKGDEQIALKEQEKSIRTEGKSLKPELNVKRDLEVAETPVEKKVNSPEINQIAGNTLDEIKVDTIKSPLPTLEKEVPTAPILAINEKKEENRTIVVNVETPENESGEKVKSSRLSKVFRQLKNARAGDPVDWQEVGFNPKNIIAKVDGKMRGKGDENAEKDQNTKRIKL